MTKQAVAYMIVKNGRYLTFQNYAGKSYWGDPANDLNSTAPQLFGMHLLGIQQAHRAVEESGGKLIEVYADIEEVKEND